MRVRTWIQTLGFGVCWPLIVEPRKLDARRNHHARGVGRVFCGGNRHNQLGTDTNRALEMKTVFRLEEYTLLRRLICARLKDHLSQRKLNGLVLSFPICLHWYPICSPHRVRSWLDVWQIARDFRDSFPQSA